MKVLSKNCDDCHGYILYIYIYIAYILLCLQRIFLTKNQAELS